MADLSSDAACAERTGTLLKVLRHPARLRIVSVLSKVGAAHVTGFEGCLELPQPVVSQQLAILRAHGLVKVERRDGYAWYSLADARLTHLVRCLEQHCCAEDPASTP